MREQHQQQMEQLVLTQYFQLLLLLVVAAVVAITEPVATVVLAVEPLLMEPTQPQAELEIHLP